MVNVGIFIDGMTLFHGLNGTRFHFSEFKDWLVGEDTIGFAGYFNSVDKPGTKQNFFIHVQKSGFETFIRKPKYDFNENKLDIKDMNIELTTEAMQHIDKYDKFILVSGKHDFLPLVEKLEDKGKEIIIVGFKNNINTLFNKYELRYIEDFLE